MKILFWIILVIIVPIILNFIANCLFAIFFRKRLKDVFDVAKFVKKSCSKLIKFFKKKYIYIPILLVVLLFFVYKLCLEDIFSLPNKLVVALTNFHLVSGAETTDNNALISHLQDSLKVYRNDIALKDSVYPEVRDSTQARELGESINAHIVIWGSIEKTSIEAEIIPRITIVQPLGKMKLEQKQPEPATNISTAELDQIAFRKRKAREITDVVLSILGLAKYKIKKYEESIEILKKIQHKSAEIFFYIGNSYWSLPKPGFLRGVTLGDSIRYEKAMKNYKEALRISADFARAHGNLGILLYELKRYEEAEKEYKEVLRINPEDAKAHYNLGILLYDLKRYEEAEKEYKEALRINPDYAEARFGLGFSLHGLKRHEEAEKEYREALRIKPDYAEAHYNLGILLVDLNRKDEAKKEFEIARDLFRKQGREEEAKKVEGFLKDL